jgi:hypothetical protein
VECRGRRPDSRSRHTPCSRTRGARRHGSWVFSTMHSMQRQVQVCSCSQMLLCLVPSGGAPHKAHAAGLRCVSPLSCGASSGVDMGFRPKTYTLNHKYETGVDMNPSPVCARSHLSAYIRTTALTRPCACAHARTHAISWTKMGQLHTTRPTDYKKRPASCRLLCLHALRRASKVVQVG